MGLDLTTLAARKLNIKGFIALFFAGETSPLFLKVEGRLLHSLSSIVFTPLASQHIHPFSPASSLLILGNLRNGFLIRWK